MFSKSCRLIIAGATAPPGMEIQLRDLIEAYGEWEQIKHFFARHFLRYIYTKLRHLFEI